MLRNFLQKCRPAIKNRSKRNWFRINEIRILNLLKTFISTVWEKSKITTLIKIIFGEFKIRKTWIKHIKIRKKNNLLHLLEKSEIWTSDWRNKNLQKFYSTIQKNCNFTISYLFFNFNFGSNVINFIFL